MYKFRSKVTLRGSAHSGPVHHSDRNSKDSCLWDITKCKITEGLNIQQHCYENFI